MTIYFSHFIHKVLSPSEAQNVPFFTTIRISVLFIHKVLRSSQAQNEAFLFHAKVLVSRRPSRLTQKAASPRLTAYDFVECIRSGGRTSIARAKVRAGLRSPA